LLIHHAVFRRLLTWGDQPAAWLQAFASNPLNIFWDSRVFEELTGENLESCQRLLQPDFAPALPWLSLDWAARWTRAEMSRWNAGVEGFARFNERQAAILRNWLAALAKANRPDLLTAPMDWLSALFARDDSAEEAAKRFRHLASDLRLSDRQELARGWERALTPARRIGEAWTRARNVHPIDREAPDKVFLAAFGERDFGRVLERVESLIQIILPTVS
jgi:hypothetical protein